MTEDERLELWRNSAVRRAGWTPLGGQQLLDPSGVDALQGVILISAAGAVLGVEYRWPADPLGTVAANCRKAL